MFQSQSHFPQYQQSPQYAGQSSMQQQNMWNQQGYSQSPGVASTSFGGQLPFAGASTTSAAPRYMPGFLTNTGTPRSQGNNTFNSPQREKQNSSDDYGNANTSMERNSPPITRGSLFGGNNTTPSNRGRNSNAFNLRHRQGAIDNDDAPPVTFMDDMDDFPPSQQQQSFLVPSSPSKSDENPSPQSTQPNLPVDNGPCKVIVFGFPPSALSALVEHFSMIGQITSVEPCPSPTGNWATLTFAQSWCAARAVRRSGELVGGSMIGVKWPEGMESAPSPRPNVQQQQVQHVQQQQQQPQQMQRGTIGTPVPILSANASDAYKPKPSTPAKGWGFGLLGGGSAAQSMPSNNNSMANAAQNPFNPGNQQTPNTNQGGMWNKVSDAIFGF